jgi:hypothetical protein
VRDHAGELVAVFSHDRQDRLHESARGAAAGAVGEVLVVPSAGEKANCDSW